MDPWEIVVIVIALLVFLGGLGIGIRTFGTGNIYSILSGLFFAVTNFIPFGLVTFGFIADLIGQTFVYSFGSITALVAIVLNWIVKFIVEPRMALPPMNLNSGISSEQGKAWCFIPGLEGLENRVMPMNFAATSAIMTYYLIFAGLRRPSTDNVSLGISLPLLLGIQSATFYFGDCGKYYADGIGGKIGAILLGSVVGASMYGIVNSIFPQNTPFQQFSPVPTSGSAGAGNKGAPLGAPPTGSKCSAANTDDDNAYVCEAYKNGVLVTEQISG